jgi:sensor histidine kinase regulating citrate/malate metabolism
LDKVAELLNGKRNLEKEQAVGFGLKIIKQVVKTLNGSILLTLKDNHIILHITIPVK